MKRNLFAIILLVLSVSCGKNGTDGLYISVDNTCWEISNETLVAWPCYIGDELATIIQYNKAYDAFQVMNGTYSLDGHRVDVAAEQAVLMIRTFSHLKNSSNKNYIRIQPSAPESMGGSLWATLRNNDFHLVYHRQDGTFMAGTYANAVHKEGIPYGWSWKTGSYSVNGNQYVAGDDKGTFFGNKFMVLDSLAVPCVSTIADTEGTSSLKGTLWTYVSSGYPGFILFSSATEFVRVLVSSNIVYSVLRGEYKLKGNSLEFKTDSEELNRTCTVSDGRFTYLDKTYSLVSSF